MRKEICEIWIEAEEWPEGQWDIYNDNTDVIVQFEDKTRWVASFFTYRNIQKVVEKYRETGECMKGKYFWSSDMVLIDDVSRKSIEKVIMHLIEEEKFEGIFRKLETDLD